MFGVEGDHIPLGALLESPGVVSLRAHGRTSIESSAGSAVIAALFTSCELDGRVTNDIQKEVWQKTIANAVINPLTAMTGMEVGWVAHKRIDRLERAIIAECYADGDRPVDFRCIVLANDRPPPTTHAGAFAKQADSLIFLK